MLDVLFEARLALPFLLQNESRWNDLQAKTKRPFLQRLWYQWGKYRISLNHFSDFIEGSAFWHPHPWKVAIHIEEGSYENQQGFYDASGQLIQKKSELLYPGSSYEMLEQNLAHAVVPKSSDVWTVMVSGPVIWPDNRLIANTATGSLSEEEHSQHLLFYRSRYPLLT